MSRLVSRCFGILTRFRDDVDAFTLRKRGIVARMPIAPQILHACKFQISNFVALFHISQPWSFERTVAFGLPITKTVLKLFEAQSGSVFWTTPLTPRTMLWTLVLWTASGPRMCSHNLYLKYENLLTNYLYSSPLSQFRNQGIVGPSRILTLNP